MHSLILARAVGDYLPAFLDNKFIVYEIFAE